MSFSPKVIKSKIGEIVGIKEDIQSVSIIEFTDSLITQRIAFDDLDKHAFSANDEYFYIDGTRFVRQNLEVNVVITARVSVV